MVQMHCSIPVANEDVLGVELTTSFDELIADVSADRPSLSDVAAPDGTVTIMFTDIESSTALAEQLGDARWGHLLREHRRTVESLAARHRGRVVKGLGDGFMIVFPSATDALSCGRDMQAQLSQPDRGGHSVKVRIGLHSGDPVRDVDDFFGHAVTVAARVAAAAGGGETLTSRLTAELARRGSFEFGPPRCLQLKGIEGPIEVLDLRLTSGSGD
jgi:class 3 adenylate cyclase